MQQEPENCDARELLDKVPLVRITDTGIPAEAAGAALELAEVGLDQLLAQGVLRDIALFGTAASAVRVIVLGRDWLLQRQITRFRHHVADIPEEKKLRFIERLKDDQTYADRVGENLLLLLHRADDIRKPRLLGRIFRALVEGEIDDLTHDRLCAAVDRIRFHNLPGLKRFYSEGYVGGSVDDETLQDLVLCGLATIVRPEGLTFGDGRVQNVRRNNLGELFIEVALGEQ